MPAEPDAIEIRVVACLVEKQRTTPDAYPLSLNALRLACNQATNRDPVVDYDEQTVSDALRRTALRGWTRLASGAGSRARKYRHLLPEALGVDDGELAVLAVLMLRGPQTPGELKGRTERLQGFADLAAVHEVLERLIERGYVVRHPRRPGQKEDRYEQVLGGGEAQAPDPARDHGPADEELVTVADSPTPAEAADEVARLDRLEAELLELKGEIARLRKALGE
ncbi:MAG TPA: YceH family protein [Solirubrobacterales bacterium]|nr:YceH family protein [Solirubrobacterales bacterium]